MREAFLKDVDKDMIKRMENEYFCENYGIFFSVFNEVDIGPLLKE